MNLFSNLLQSVRLNGSSYIRMMSTVYANGYDLTEYHAPEWASKINNIPKWKIQMCQKETPIRKWNIVGVPSKFSLHIKRDDMTACTVSGNKIRKLEFLLADAVEQGCKHIITCGGIQSNHARTTAVAAAQLGLKCNLVLRSSVLQDVNAALSLQGNMLLNRLSGAKVYYVPTPPGPGRVYEAFLKPRMEKIADKIREQTGESSYLMPIGGSTHIGLFGYISCFQELISQGLFDYFDDIVVPCGSGGTTAGLAIANYLTGSRLRVHGVIVCDGVEYFEDHINTTLDEAGLTEIRATDIVDLVDGHKGRGYGLSTEEELEFIVQTSASSGIMLDHTYTGKAAKGLVQELQDNPNRFKGTRILFIHTGGIFSLFDGRMEDIMKSTATSSQVVMYPDLNSDPPPM